MFEQLSEIMKQVGHSAVVENAAVPNEHNEAVMQEAQKSILDGIQNMNPAQITQMVEQGTAANGEGVNNITNQFAGNIAEKFGINSGMAKTIGASLIPIVLGKLMNKAKDPNDQSFGLQDILGSLTGGGAAAAGNGGIQNTINSIGSKFGLDKDGDGDVDLNDVTKLFGK